MGKLALQRLNSYGLLIRSTTGISIPSLVCIRKPTKVSRTKSPRRNGRNKLRRRRGRGGREKYLLNCFWKSHFHPSSYYTQQIELNFRTGIEKQHLCDPQWFRDTASRGLKTFVTPKPHFRTNPSDHGKASSNIAHDPLGIIDSVSKNQSIMVSVQYSPFNSNIPIRSTTIGKSRVARDPIIMHTSWRSNSNIACVTSIRYPCTRASGESSTTKHRILHTSRPHPTSPPDDPN
ncbi:hypothetical protein F511_18671 [Dorcoceras hygrometricum]|uniref:Uncharacterized protein n=1 Tax=Dorcoceras hygrometricum TaxID=472368 RepID=A0A2Z7AI89_9LAMI|nr:hypothetical protein F511_18671 [Dorcoceras hygrometricum]